MSARAVRIDALQGAMLTVSIPFPTMILFLPAFAAREAGEDAWLAGLIGMAGAMLLALISIALARRFPRLSLIQYAELSLGRPLGKAAGLLFLLWIFHLTAIVAREFGEFMVEMTMPQTPISVFVIVILLLAAYAARQGVEVLARANQIILGLTALSLIILVLLAANRMQAEFLMPVLGSRPSALLRGAYAPLAWMGEVVIATIAVFPQLTDPQRIRPVTLWALLFTGLTSSLMTLVTLAALGRHWVVTSSLPVLAVTRYVEIGDFLERLEPIFVAVWVSGTFIKLAILLYALAQGTAQWLGLRDHRPLVLPLLTLITPLTFHLFESGIELRAFVSHFFPVYSVLPFELGIPLLLLLVAAVRRLRGGEAGSQQPGCEP